jgi:hypothetical protein
MKPGIAEITFAEMNKLTTLNEYVFDTFLDDYAWKYSHDLKTWYLVSESKKNCLLALNRWGRCIWSRELYTDIYERYLGLSLSEFRMVIRVYIRDILDKEVDEFKVTKQFRLPPHYYFKN